MRPMVEPSYTFCRRGSRGRNRARLLEKQYLILFSRRNQVRFAQKVAHFYSLIIVIAVPQAVSGAIIKFIMRNSLIRRIKGYQHTSFSPYVKVRVLGDSLNISVVVY